MKETVVGRIEQLTGAAPAPLVPTLTGSTAFIAETAVLKARIAELEKYEHLCRLALASLDQGQSVQFGSAWHEQLRSLMGSYQCT